MIALVISSAWDKYYASSPFKNLLKGEHPDFKLLPVLPHQTDGEEFRAQVNECSALICDDVLIRRMDFYKNGPKLMIGGDPHAHTTDQVLRLEAEYAEADYVLTGAVFGRKLSRYLYPSDVARDKHIYYPHSVPDLGPVLRAWGDRHKAAILSGSMDPAVYPFRSECRAESQRGGAIHVVDNVGRVENDYYEMIGAYQAAITCNSVFGYTVAKYFEIPWTGAVLMAPPIDDEEALLLGLEDRVNVVWIKSSAFISSEIRAMMLGLGDFESISQNGMALMEKHHTIFRRLDYLKHLVERVSRGGFTPRDAKDLFLNHRKGLL